MAAYNFAPPGYAECNGQILPISQNTALFSLIGVQFGGNGSSTFGLPDLRSRVPLGIGQGTGLSSYTIGQQSDAETVTLLTNQLPSHTHPLNVNSNGGNAVTPVDNLLAPVRRGVDQTKTLADVRFKRVRGRGGEIEHDGSD